MCSIMHILLVSVVYFVRRTRNNHPAKCSKLDKDACISLLSSIWPLKACMASLTRPIDINFHILHFIEKNVEVGILKDDLLQT